MEQKTEKLVRDKEQELLEKYFPLGDFDLEEIGSYGKDLPLKVEAEFREYLSKLWAEYSDEPLVLEEQKLRTLMTESDIEAMNVAYEVANRVTLLERITGSNHEDVNHYKSLLRQYTAKLLMIMRIDFLEEITGRHITGKAFDEDED